MFKTFVPIEQELRDPPLPVRWYVLIREMEAWRANTGMGLAHTWSFVHQGDYDAARASFADTVRDYAPGLSASEHLTSAEIAAVRRVSSELDHRHWTLRLADRLDPPAEDVAPARPKRKRKGPPARDSRR